MGPSPLLSNAEFFKHKLLPVLSLSKYASMKVTYQLALDGAGTVVGDEYLIERGLKIHKKHPLGLEPYMLRAADNDDPVRIAEFLYQCSIGKLHPATFQYLLSVPTQMEIKTGQRPSIPAWRSFGTMEEKQTPTQKLMTGFDQEVAIDEDYRRVARKVEEHKAEAVLAERPHLLEDKK